MRFKAFQQKSGSKPQNFVNTSELSATFAVLANCSRQAVPFGAPNRVTVPYSATARQTTPTPQAATTLTYDALGRPLKTIDGGGGYTQYQYTQNDVLVTRGPAPAGENLKTRQLQYDGLGRLISVCEVTTGSETGQCYQTAAATGYLTKYSYDPLGNLLNVSENSLQTRTYAYDGLSRMTSSADPETKNVAGTTTYDSDLTCGSSSGDAVRTTDAAGNVVCSSFDKLHRVTSRTYPSGPYALTTSQKIYVYDSATVNGVAMTYSKGLLAEAYTTMSNSTITDLGFSYDIRGEQDGVYETTPHSGGYYRVYVSQRDYDGTPLIVSSSLALPASQGGIVGYALERDGEGRVLRESGSDVNIGFPIGPISYTPLGPSLFVWNYGDSGNTYIADAYSFDANTGRLAGYGFQVGNSSISGSLTWNADGTLRSTRITDPVLSSNNQTCRYLYDDLSRLSNADCGSIWGQAFSYGPLGNMAASAIPGESGTSFLPTYSSATNRYLTLPSGMPAYDGNGNVTNDGFHTYAWNADGQNTQIDSSASVMTYDALGRWVEMSQNGQATQALYGVDGSKFASMSGQTVITSYLHGPMGSMVTYTGGYITEKFWHPDWLGNTRLTTGARGSAVDDRAYAPFGQQYLGTPINSFFTGVAQSAQAPDIKDFPARNYQLNSGRWLTPDPVGLAAVDLTNPQTLNRYAYAGNNPLSNVDPTGTSWASGLWGKAWNWLTSSNDDESSSPYGSYAGENSGLIFYATSSAHSPVTPQSARLNQQLNSSSPAKNGTKTCASGNNGGAIWTGTYTLPLTGVGALIGSLAGPEGTLPGALIGSMFGVGPTASFVPSTHSVYAGLTLVGGLGISGGGGGSINVVNVPRGQNPNSIANGQSYSMTYQPTPFTGATATKSPGSGPPVVGPSFGTRIPVAAGASYNICLWNCGCGG